MMRAATERKIQLIRFFETLIVQELGRTSFNFKKEGIYGVREGALRRKYMLTYIFFVRPLLEHGVYEKVPYEKYMLTYIFFVRPLLEHGVYEKVPYEKYMLTYIFFVRPLLEHGVYEKVPCAHACARLSRLSFRALLTSG